MEEDESAAETGSNAGNLLARLPGPGGSRTILLCAHLDTVPLDAPVDVQLEHGVFRNRNRAILGADNKAAVATILAAARRLAREGAPVALELLFTTCEELALLGAKSFDSGRLRSDYGFVFDHASPVGELIVAAPTYYRIEARFQGTAAHAGIRPEDGHSAIVAAARAVATMPLGRVDAESTANAGRIEGGNAGNVVPERCRVELEARSLDETRAGELVGRLVDACSDAASDTDCDVETAVERQFRGFRLSRSAPPVQAASAALAQLGVEPCYRASGGGSDANVFVARGLPVLNVANGTERNHQPDESVTVEALQRTFELTLGIVRASAG